MNEYNITVTRRGSERLDQGYTWVYRSDIKSPPEAAPEGAIVRILDGRGWYKGRGFWSTRSQIALRLLTREDSFCDRAFFRGRIQKALELREAMFPGTRTYRLIHGDADQISGLVIDRYNDVFVVQLLCQGTDRMRNFLVQILKEVFPDVRAIVERSDARTRQLEGLELKKGIIYGEDPGPVEFKEGEISHVIDLMEGQKTGGFLDQRENHILAGKYAYGEALDCFSYTGGFALQMAKGRCSHVTAVEISESASEFIRENARRNGLSNLAVATDNVFDFLNARIEEGKKYDTIVLDPPAFAKNKSAIEAALRGYKEINLRAMQLLKPGGILVSASCSFHVDEAMFEEMLEAAAKDAHRSIQIVEKRGAGRDHPVLLGMKETRYLKCFFLRVL